MQLGFLEKNKAGRSNLPRRLAYLSRAGELDPRFLNWLGAAFGFSTPPQTLGTADKMVPWLHREWMRKPRISPEKVLAVRDWWVATRQDLGGFTFAEADVAQRAWHRELAAHRKRAEVAFALRGPVVMSFEDGASWHRVEQGTADRATLKSLRAVGESLGHCYAKAPVLRDYLQTHDLYTLYDARGEPHVTAAIKDGQVVEAKRTEDVDVEYESAWAPRVVALLVAQGWRWSAATTRLADVDTLARLAEDSDWGVRWGVAQNPRTALAVLARLAKDSDSDVRWGVARNPRTALAVLARLAEDSDWGVRRAVAQNPRTAPAVLARLAEDSDWIVRWNVARNPRTAPAVLARLAKDSTWSVRWKVAKNPRTAPAVLARLAEDSDSDVRRGVAQNPHTPPAVLARLAKDADQGVRWAVAQNPRTRQFGGRDV